MTIHAALAKTRRRNAHKKIWANRELRAGVGKGILMGWSISETCRKVRKNDRKTKRAGETRPVLRE
jgi:hypothetical protein